MTDNTPTLGSIRSKLLPLTSDGWWKDGWPHERDAHGFCWNCGAMPYEPHYRLKPKEVQS